jgi:bacterial/archaeal transporter family protein
MKTEFFVVLSIIGWGTGSFLYKLANNSLHPVMVSTIAMCLYTCLLPMIWIFFKFDHTINLHGVIYALVGSLFMCVATLGFSYALRSGGEVGRVTFMTALYPSLTLILSMIFLHESISVKKGTGIVLALASFLLLSIK